LLLIAILLFSTLRHKVGTPYRISPFPILKFDTKEPDPDHVDKSDFLETAEKSTNFFIEKFNIFLPSSRKYLPANMHF
jgi:hypothetical protein